MTAQRLAARAKHKPWVHYRPTWRVVTVGGGSTQPTRPSDAVGYKQVEGRWVRLSSGLVVVQLQANFPFGGTYGVGDAYLFGLPVAAGRSPRGEGIMVEGTGMAYQALQDPSMNMPISPCLVRRGEFVELAGGAEDHHMAFTFPYYYEIGSGSWNGALDTVAHACPWTPRAQDFTVTAASLTDSGNTLTFPWQVRNIDADSFDIGLRNGTGAGTDITYGWKLISPPPGGVTKYVGPRKPWTWTAFWKIFAQFTYMGQQ